MQPRANKTTIQVIQWSNGYCKKRQDGSQGKPARDTVMKIKIYIYIYTEKEKKRKVKHTRLRNKKECHDKGFFPLSVLYGAGVKRIHMNLRLPHSQRQTAEKEAFIFLGTSRSR